MSNKCVYCGAKVEDEDVHQIGPVVMHLACVIRQQEYSKLPKERK